MDKAKEIIVDGVVYVEKRENVKNDNGLEFVLIRTYSAGVHFGYLEKREGKECVLVNARRIWSWEGAFTLSQIAMTGTSNPNECNLSIECDKIILTECIEIISITKESKKILDSIKGTVK